MKRADVLDEVQFLRASGESEATICGRLDMTPAAIARALYRVDRPDLARPFERMRPHRPGSCRFCGAPTSAPRVGACWTHKELYRLERHPRRQAVA